MKKASSTERKPASPSPTRRLFGTDGIRGVANEHPMTPEVALQLGRAVTFVAGRGKSHVPRILVGKDTRLSGYMLEQAIASGVCAMEGRGHALRTDAHAGHRAHLTVSMRADAGIVISASHNPYQDNGIKVFGADGFKLPDSAELEMERMMADDALLGKRSTGPGIGRSERPRGRAGALRGLPQADVSERPVARWRARRRRRGPRSRISRRAPGPAGARCPGDGHRREAERDEHQPRLRRALSRERPGGSHQARGGDRHCARRRRGPSDRHRREGPDRRRRPRAGDVRTQHGGRRELAKPHRRGDGDVESRPRACARAVRRQAREDPGRGPLRRPRQCARAGTTSEANNPGTWSFSTMHRRARRNARGAEGPRSHAANGQARVGARRTRDAARPAGPREHHPAGPPPARRDAAAVRYDGEDRK